MHHFDPPYTELCIMCDNDPDAEMKLDYCNLKKKGYVLLCAGFGIQQPYPACIIDIVEWLEEVYIAFCLPRSTLLVEVEESIFKATVVEDALDNVLYLCPVNRFIRCIQIIKSAASGEDILVM